MISQEAELIEIKIGYLFWAIHVRDGCLLKGWLLGEWLTGWAEM